MGWRWIETYIWAKPNAVPGKFGPRTKDAFEYVYHFARGPKPYFDLESIRVPYKADASEIERRKKDTLGRRSTEAGFGRDRTKTYLRGGADPGNVVAVAQSYNQYKGVAHTAAMPEGLAEFFVKAACPVDGVVIDPFAGGGTTVVVGRRLGRRAVASSFTMISSPRRDGGLRQGSHGYPWTFRRNDERIIAMAIDSTIDAIVNAGTWAQRIQQIRLVPSRHGTELHDAIYSAVARKLYVKDLAPTSPISMRPLSTRLHISTRLMKKPND